MKNPNSRYWTDEEFRKKVKEYSRRYYKERRDNVSFRMHRSELHKKYYRIKKWKEKENDTIG